MKSWFTSCPVWILKFSALFKKATKVIGFGILMELFGEIDDKV